MGNNTGRSCGHSKIARVARVVFVFVVFVFILYVAVLTSLQFLTVTLCWVTRHENCNEMLPFAKRKSGCHEVMRRGLTSHSTLYTCTPSNELRSPGCAPSLGFLMGYIVVSVATARRIVFSRRHQLHGLVFLITVLSTNVMPETSRVCCWSRYCKI